MNREILFRGQTRRKGEKVRLDGSPVPSNWVYGGILPNNNGGDFAIIYQQEPEFDKFPVYADTICQYTELNDKKNDKKIFEGDICDFSVFDYNGHDTQYRGVVVYAGSKFVLWKSKDSEYYGADGGFDLDWTIAQDDEFEVVGNIFDNPELLDKAGEPNGES